MSKLKINDKRPFGKENNLTLKIDTKSYKLSSNKNQELEIEQGEHELRVYELFFMMKSRPVKIDITENKTEIDVSYNYVSFLIMTLLNLSIVLTILLKLENFFVFHIILVLTAQLILLTFIGIYRIKVKNIC